ncbi:glycosyltransferase family 2 protein [Clostridium sp. CCUG 7971]|uniref:glycosyltransferase family 2 protein n=1 Tax=Clostridium sp. CCUG 7971 TaxID=2811414 RepID=UPI001ABAE0C4|nr:glycosyltransferase family 2 protein [Clostridium sp. CCUG 7971]MBO3443025.1 glycosyltransferase family 2 protein [Clostridium sp. CCUG 7971]
MYKYRFTIFTPTYNRGYILTKLYNDLKNQTFKDFEWLIVDDGSTDNSEELINKFKTENILNINYIKKENGGKHTAINTGVKNACGELFFIVDSDDGLVNDSLQVIVDEWNSIEDKTNLSGVVGLCEHTNGEIVGTKMPEEHQICHFADLYFKYNVKGDKSLVLLTDVIKKYPFPERKEVNFLPESVVWHEISKDYKVKCINKTMIIRDYLDDGLTQNIMSKSSLKGRALEFLYLINQNTYQISKYPYMWLKNYINLARYSLLSESSYFKEINKLFDKCMYIMLFPLGYLKFAKSKKLIAK